MIFLYSSSPAPYEPVILAACRGLRRIVLQTPVEAPAPSELVTLRQHFPDVADAGLAERADAFDPDVVEAISTADLILITGGSPQRLVACTTGTPALAALRGAWEGGATIAACSAGAMVFGAGMPGSEFWGWLPDTVVAPHYGQYDIEGWRTDFPSCRIVGIPDASMAVADRDLRIRPVGTSRLTVLDPISRDS